MKTQRGWTVWTLLLTAGVIVFFSLLVAKLWPHYLDNFKIQAALETITNDTRITSMSKREIVQELKNALYIDYGDEIVDLDDSLIIEKRKNSMSLMVDYEVVVPLAYNISALLDFSNRADLIY